MKAQSCLFLLLMLISIHCFGQKKELGKVTKVELLEKQHKSDTSAAAAIIFKKAHTKYNYTEEHGFTSETSFLVKLKIYKTEGLKWANFKIPYYIGYENLEDEYVGIISGYTYNLEEGKIVKSKVTGESKFKEKMNENWEQKSVAFPNVKIGSIIELEYKFKSENLNVLPEFKFQYDIPVDFAEFKTEIPEFFIYKGIQKGYVNVMTEQKLEYTSQSFMVQADKARVSRNMQYKQIMTLYTVLNVPALKEEDYVNNMNNYYGQIEHELQVIRYPEEKPKPIATTWEDVAKSIYDNKDFKAAVNTFDYFSNDVKSTISGVTTELEKAKKIFRLVKSRMSWNENYGYYPNRKMEVAYAEKVGNVAEINLMLVTMLRMAGIDANPVLVSTRENGLATFPNRTLFNYVIAAAKINDKIILMDATDKLSDVNLLPVRALNGQGRLIRSDATSDEIELMPKLVSKDVVNVIGSINDNGGVSGKIREHYSDYNAFVFRDRYNGVAKESYIERLEKRYQGLEITEYEVQNSLDLDLPIIENYGFIDSNSVEIIGDKMYVSPLLIFQLDQNPFKQEVREYPVDFMFPNQDKYTISLTIPDGYAIETVPEPQILALPANLGSFKYETATKGDQIQIGFTQEVNQAVIDAGYYEALKIFYKQMVSKQSEKIVLKKV